MSRHSHFEPDRIDTSTLLGARELTSFDLPPANDNSPHGLSAKPTTPAGLGLPIAAFATGVTAAFVVAGLSHLFGIAT